MTVTFSAPVEVAVRPAPVTFSAPVEVSVHGAAVVFSAPVVVSVGPPERIMFGAPVIVHVRGAGVMFTADLSVLIKPFRGTGIIRGRRRTIDPARTRSEWIPPTPPPPPPTPEPVAPTLRYYEHPYWTTPLDADEPLASTSADLVERLAYQARMSRDSEPVYGFYNPPYSTTVNGGNPNHLSFALPIYLMDPETPRVPVYSTRVKAHLQDQLDEGVPLPDPALIPDGALAPSGTDGALVIICGDEVWEFWQFRPRNDTDPVGYPWICTQGGYIADKTTHPAIWRTIALGGYGWGVSASGMSKLTGMLRAEDYYSDTIEHPLGLALPLTGGSHAVTPHEPDRLLPAARFDRKNFVPGGATGQYPAIDALRVPEGARFRLPPDFDADAYVNSLPVVDPGPFGSDPETLRKILVCLRDYGIIINDSAGVVAFGAENPKTYGTPYHPFTRAEVPTWGNFGYQLPWESLLQVAAPTTVIAAVGP